MSESSAKIKLTRKSLERFGKVEVVDKMNVFGLDFACTALDMGPIQRRLGLGFSLVSRKDEEITHALEGKPSFCNAGLAISFSELCWGGHGGHGGLYGWMCDFKMNSTITGILVVS